MHSFPGLLFSLLALHLFNSIDVCQTYPLCQTLITTCINMMYARQKRRQWLILTVEIWELSNRKRSVTESICHWRSLWTKAQEWKKKTNTVFWGQNELSFITWAQWEYACVVGIRVRDILVSKSKIQNCVSKTNWQEMRCLTMEHWAWEKACTPSVGHSWTRKWQFDNSDFNLFYFIGELLHSPFICVWYMANYKLVCNMC